MMQHEMNLKLGVALISALFSTKTNNPH